MKTKPGKLVNVGDELSLTCRAEFWRHGHCIINSVGGGAGHDGKLIC